MNIRKHAEELLEDIARELQIPSSKYEAAERSYTSVGNWLHRENSTLRNADPQVYVQGSFRLGTAIKPISEEDDYDIDLVCELSLSKSDLTQSQLKEGLGYELFEYAKAHGMAVPDEGKRCWTQKYADGSQFHVDTLPAVPDGETMNRILASKGYTNTWVNSAIAITDREHPKFREITEYWPHSNPRGYGDWFRSKMSVVFDQRRKALALEIKASVEDVPDYTVRTPLQSAIQILKRHRDMMFIERPDDKPISIILTTLAAHAYQQESTISSALYSILDSMESYIEDRNGVVWIANPTDPAENFADRWLSYPSRRTAFYDWLRQAKKDFYEAGQSLTKELAGNVLSPRLGKRLVEASINKGGNGYKGSSVVSSLRKYGKVLNPLHRKPPPWRANSHGSVNIGRATYRRNGFRSQLFDSDGKPVPKNCDLKFEAETNIPKPFQVYWQVVNTGHDAEAANCLRGGFVEGVVSPGWLVRTESTSYTGAHSIECFVVKNGLLAARSGQFIVNIL